MGCWYDAVFLGCAARVESRHTDSGEFVDANGSADVVEIPGVDSLGCIPLGFTYCGIGAVLMERPVRKKCGGTIRRSPECFSGNGSIVLRLGHAALCNESE